MAPPIARRKLSQRALQRQTKSVIALPLLQFLFVLAAPSPVESQTAVVSTLAGSTTAGNADGRGANASFNSPQGIDVSSDSSVVYVVRMLGFSSSIPRAHNPLLAKHRPNTATTLSAVSIRRQAS